MIIFRFGGAQIEEVERYPTQYEIYNMFRTPLKSSRRDIISTEQYRNALGQFRHGDLAPAYGFLHNKNLDFIIKNAEDYSSNKRTYYEARAKVTCTEPVKMAVIDIDIDKKEV